MVVLNCRTLQVDATHPETWQLGNHSSSASESASKTARPHKVDLTLT